MRLNQKAIAAVWAVITFLTVGNAFLHNKQFYPSMVYITKSNQSLAVLYVQAIIILYFIFQLVRKIFFGELRAAEADHLSERTWHAVLETCLAFTVFRDDFSPIFVMQFVMLLFFKSFHWLADERVDQMERSPIITMKFHIRMLLTIAILGMIDSHLVSHAYFSILSRGASSQIVFGFEYAILLTLVFHVTIKYILHMHDLRTAQPWENKAVYLLYTELVINLAKCLLYGFFAGVMMRLHTFPLFSVRPFYLSLRALQKAFNDVVLSRRAIAAMNNLFPIVSNEELAGMDATCIICREEMTAESQPKRLPCSHVFHAHCLRNWFQRQQTCPTCRTDILGGVPRETPAAPAPGGAGAPQAPNDAAPPRHFVFHAPVYQTPPPNGNVTQQPTGAPQQGSSFSFSFDPTMFAGIGFPPPHPNLFFPPPPPPPFSFPDPPNFEGLTDEELVAMEGREREAVINRIKALRNIQVLLNAAETQFKQIDRVSTRTTDTVSPSTSTNVNNVDEGTNN